jgi:hypothetical protein
MIRVITNSCIFKTVTDTNVKQLENSKETRKSFRWQTFTVTYQPWSTVQLHAVELYQVWRL